MKVVVAAFPLVSDGGVYTYLRSTLAEFRRQDVPSTLLWSSRVRSDWGDRAQDGQEVPWRASLRGLVDARRALEDALQDPEAVLVTVLPQADVVAATLPRRLRRRWVMQVHGQPYPQQSEERLWRRWAWRLLWHAARRRCPGRLYVSDHLRQDLDDPTGGRFRAPVDPGALVELPDRVTLAFVGRLSHEKGLDRFLAAVAGRGERVVIRGDGPLAAVARRAAAERTGTTFDGWVTGEARWDGISVVVVSSRREGLSLVALEAQARGIPVVAVPVGGVPEAMSDELLSRGALCHGPELDDGIRAVLASLPEIDRAAMRRWVLQRHSPGPATADLVEALRSVADPR